MELSLSHRELTFLSRSSYNELHPIHPIDSAISAPKETIVLPGDRITSDMSYLCGHGTFINTENQIISNSNGILHRTNQLLSVTSLKSRYIPKIGDVIVGRITKVTNNRWKVDIQSWKDAHLLLSSIILPSALQRRRTYEDQYSMREYYEENDIISCEVQDINADNTTHLHTRNIFYGKCRNGAFIQVRPTLMKQLKQHAITLEKIQIDLILGMNGYIFISRTIPNAWIRKIMKQHEREKKVNSNRKSNEFTGSNASMKEEEDEEDEEIFYAEDEENIDLKDIKDIDLLLTIKAKHEKTPITKTDRNKICRVRRCILKLNQEFIRIIPENIMKLYENEDESTAVL